MGGMWGAEKKKPQRSGKKSKMEDWKGFLVGASLGSSLEKDMLEEDVGNHYFISFIFHLPKISYNA